MNIIDLNCDMGESFGPYTIGNDTEILPYITSANIACGFHAGDPRTMKRTVKLALENHVGIGAHPGLHDLAGFGRRKMDISPQDAYDMVLYQIGALSAFVKAEGGNIQHIKPHGALYNMAAKNQALSEAIAEAVYKVDPEIILFGLAGGELVKAGKKLGLRTANEVFSDRTYQVDGTLTPRSHEQALIHDKAKAVNQVIGMIKNQEVQSLEGKVIPIQADTVCIHGDGAQALEIAKYIHNALKKVGINIAKISEFI